jgi:hypothetical protein
MAMAANLPITLGTVLIAEGHRQLGICRLSESALG